MRWRSPMLAWMHILAWMCIYNTLWYKYTVRYDYSSRLFKTSALSIYAWTGSNDLVLVGMYDIVVDVLRCRMCVVCMVEWLSVALVHIQHGLIAEGMITPAVLPLSWWKGRIKYLVLHCPHNLLSWSHLLHTSWSVRQLYTQDPRVHYSCSCGYMNDIQFHLPVGGGGGGRGGRWPFATRRRQRKITVEALHFSISSSQPEQMTDSSFHTSLSEALLLAYQRRLHCARVEGWGWHNWAVNAYNYNEWMKNEWTAMEVLLVWAKQSSLKKSFSVFKTFTLSDKCSFQNHSPFLWNGSKTLMQRNLRTYIIVLILVWWELQPWIQEIWVIDLSTRKFIHREAEKLDVWWDNTSNVRAGDSSLAVRLTRTTSDGKLGKGLGTRLV